MHQQQLQPQNQSRLKGSKKRRHCRIEKSTPFSMVLASFFNKGGVGKTTLAIHLAGVLSQNSIDRTLVIDCVDQADAFEFFAGRGPNREKEIVKGKDSISTIYNPYKERIGDVTSEEEYDHIILDINSPIRDASQVILDNPIEKIFLPINCQRGALKNIPGTLAAISKIGNRTGFSPEPIIVPLGSYKKDIKERIRSSNCSIPNGLKMTERINKNRKKFDEVVEQREYVWDVEKRLRNVRETLRKTL